MPSLRRSLLLGLALATSACSSSDLTQATGPSTEPAVVATTIRIARVDAQGSMDQPLDAWMGSSVQGVLRVRVVDGRGGPVSGAAVRFAANGYESVSSSNSDGIATAAPFLLAVRDTSVAAQVITARLLTGDTVSMPLVVRAWRDLAHFGGDAPLALVGLPIDRADVAGILPLGTFRADDGLPSADARVVPVAGATPAVRAMADGVITDLDPVEGAITMRVRDAIRVRLSNVALRDGLWVGKTIRAGDTLGLLLTATAEDGLGVRVLDAAVQHTRFARPERYGARRSASFFVRYLADSVRSAAFALVRRAAPDLDGRIDYDREGRVIGTWFDAASPLIINAANALASSTVPQTPTTFASAPVAELDPSDGIAPMAITFAYDAERPGQVRIAIGGALASALGVRGVRAVAWDDADPAEVDLAQGLQRYHLFATDDALRFGRSGPVMLVQLLDANSLRVEIVTGAGADQARFSSRAITLVR